MSVSLVISFVLKLQLFVYLSQSRLTSPRTELPNQCATCWSEIQICQDNYSTQPLERPGGAWDFPVHFDHVHSNLFAIWDHKILLFPMCVMTPESLGGTV